MPPPLPDPLDLTTSSAPPPLTVLQRSQSKYVRVWSACGVLYGACKTCHPVFTDAWERGEKEHQLLQFFSGGQAVSRHWLLLPEATSPHSRANCAADGSFLCSWWMQQQTCRSVRVHPGKRQDLILGSHQCVNCTVCIGPCQQ